MSLLISVLEAHSQPKIANSNYMKIIEINIYFTLFKENTAFFILWKWVMIKL